MNNKQVLTAEQTSRAHLIKAPGGTLSHSTVKKTIKSLKKKMSAFFIIMGITTKGGVYGQHTSFALRAWSCFFQSQNVREADA
jgi:hypothetical protein